MRTTQVSLFSGPVPRRLGSTSRLATAAWALAAIVAACLASAAGAQEYRSDPVDNDARMNRVHVQQCVRGQANFAADSRFADFFNKYYFPLMTQSTPDALQDLGKARYDLFRFYLWSTTNEALQRDLTERAFTAMRQIVIANNPPYHPSVRYNAILVIGMLDQQYAIESGANRRPPQPLPQATEFLLQVVAAADAGKAIPPPLLVGALIGLERHAQYSQSLPADSIAKIMAASLKIATREESFPGVSREVFAWIRLQAARNASQLGTPGPEGRVHQALVQLVGEARLGLDNRASAAALLANINYEEAAVDGAETAGALFGLARDIATAEARRAREFEDMQIGGAMGGGMGFRGGGDDRGDGGGFIAPQGVRYQRREMLARILDLRTALTAARPLVPEEVQARFDAILAPIGAVITAAANADTIDLDVVGRVRTMTADIERAAAPRAAPPEQDDGSELTEE